MVDIKIRNLMVIFKFAQAKFYRWRQYFFLLKWDVDMKFVRKILITNLF